MRLFHLCKCESTSSIGGKRRDGTARQCALPALCRSQRRDVSKPDLPGSRHSVGLSPVRATRYSVESDVHSRPDQADTHPLVGLRSPRTIGVRNHCSPVPTSSAPVLAISHPSFAPRSSAHRRQFKQWFLAPFSITIAGVWDGLLFTACSSHRVGGGKGVPVNGFPLLDNQTT